MGLPGAHRTVVVTPDELRAARAALQLSQRDLARLLGVQASTVARWELEGGHRPPAYLTFALAWLRLANEAGQNKEEVQ